MNTPIEIAEYKEHSILSEMRKKVNILGNKKSASLTKKNRQKYDDTKKGYFVWK